MFYICIKSTSSTYSSTGYGPSGRWNRLFFDGDADKYEQWEIKFLGYMRLKNLKQAQEQNNTPERDIELGPPYFYTEN